MTLRSRSWVIDFNRCSGKAQGRRATLSCDSSYYHIWAWRPSWSCDLNFVIKLLSPLPWMRRIKIQVIDQAVSEKIFEKCVWTTDRPRSRDDLDLNKSHTFIYSISCLHLPRFMKIGPPVLGKKIFERFLTYMGVAAILVM